MIIFKNLATNFARENFVISEKFAEVGTILFGRNEVSENKM